MKSAIEIFIRTRPTNNFASKNIKIEEEKGTIKINIPKKVEDGLINHQQENWNFKFDKILLNQSQETVFDLTTKNAVQSALDGISSSIIAFGQTGAGKTFTIVGLNNDYRYRGLIPRAISHLFDQITKKSDFIYKISINYVEIYNETLHDLLHPELNDKVVLQEDSVFGVIPKGAAMIEAKSPEEALELMFLGETNRTICEHKLNKQSSRSHAIFTILIESRSRVESSEKVVVSKLSIVDLAGSERTKKTGSWGGTLLEASFINKSLSYLEQLVVALGDKNRGCLPYRQSKLTYLLKDSIGGNCKSTVIANIWPEKDHLEETISTLRFASRMTLVTNSLQQRVKLDPKELLKKYERIIKDLKTELAMHDTLVGRGRISYEAYTPEQQYQQQELAQKFLNNEIEDIDIESIRQVKELFYQFRNIYRNLLLSTEKQKEKSVKEEIQKLLSKKSLVKNSSFREENSKIGHLENLNGFGLGTAPNDSVPLNSKKKDYTINKKIVRVDKEEDEIFQQNSRSFTDQELKDFNSNFDKKKLFEQYKENQGKEIVTKLQLVLEDLRKNKALFDSDKIKCEKMKQEIDEGQIFLKNKFAEINYNEMNPQQLEEINELKKMKKNYNIEFENYNFHKRTVRDLQKKLKDVKIELVQGFDNTLKENFNINLDYFGKKNSISKISERSKENLNSQEEIYEQALKKFITTNKARKLEKLIGLF